MFADDVKVYKIIKSIHDVFLLQMCLNNIFNWSKNWQLFISFPKCACLILGKNKFVLDNYLLGDFKISFVTDISDLGVYIDSDLKFGIHCAKIFKKAWSRACVILKCFYSRDVSVYSKAFSVYVRPILEYNCVVWSPFFKKDIYLLESVQRSFTHRACKLCNVPGYMSYERRLELFNLQPLFVRRQIIDNVEVFKTVKGFAHSGLMSDLPLERNNLRGHRYKLRHLFLKHRASRQFLFNRVVNKWNSLPDDSFNTNLTECFKRRFT